MEHLSIYELTGFFFIYAFLGWCVEVCFQALTKGKLVNRGFLNGPICPIYGISVVVIIWLLAPLASHGLLLFFASFLLCSLLEWMTGFLLEKLFHQRWWDYSKEPFNIGGYVCTRFSIMWGLACVFVVYIVHPTIVWLFSFIPHTLGIIALCALGAVFLIDCISTAQAMAGLNKKLRHIEKSAAKLRRFSDDITEALYEGSIKARDDAEKARVEIRTQETDIKEKLSQEKSILQSKAKAQKKLAEEYRMELEKKLTYGQKRLLKAFPSMNSTRYKRGLEDLKRQIEQYKKQKGDRT